MTSYPEGPAASPGFLLWHVTLRWQRTVAAVLGPLDLTHVQFVLLACAWWLEGHGRAPNQRELAHQAGTDVKMTSQVVRRLEDKGLLRRDVDRTDSRARRLGLTAAGSKLVQRAIEAVERVDEEFFGDEIASVTPVLQRLTGLAPDAPALTGSRPR